VSHTTLKISEFSGHFSKFVRRTPRAPLIVAASFALAAVAGCAADLENPSQYGSSGGVTATGSGGNTAVSSGGNTGVSSGGMTATGSGGMTANIPADPACLAPLMKAQCTTCHAPGQALSQGLDLTAANIGSRLAGKPSTQAGCGGLLIDPTTPANSLMLVKVKGPTSNSCGLGMPYGTNGLTGTDLQCVTDWINSFGH